MNIMSSGGGAFGHPPPSHHPPTRDAQSIKYVLYGPGHEKFPSWPMAAAAEVPVASKAPPATGSSQRSKSWTDHTTYPKDQIVAYTRPYMKRSNNYPLRPVMERHDKKGIETSMHYLQSAKSIERRMDNVDYNHSRGDSSIPERDAPRREAPNKMGYRAYSKESIAPLTQADLEEYAKKFDESVHVQHQKQSSYAQSEGYHSYVSSSDSSTPFIDSLRRDIDASAASISRISSWDGESIVTTRSGSVSSSETLKWHGSLSDMSDVSNSSGTSPRQLIVHSARVQTPQKQNSESVLYMARTGALPDRPLPHRSLSYTLPNQRFIKQASNQMYPAVAPARKTVAECINIYEGKNIKAIQKKALLSFYERHQDQFKKDAKSPEADAAVDLPVPKRSHPPTENHSAKAPPPAIVTCDSPNSIFQGPVIMGPSISLDEWVPERPPKNRHLRNDQVSKPPPNARRAPSPELPLPSPPLPASDVDIAYKCDEPFPPPPPQDKDRQFQWPNQMAKCESQAMAKDEMSSFSNAQKLRDASCSQQFYNNNNNNAMPAKFAQPPYNYGSPQKRIAEKVPPKLSSNHHSLSKADCEGLPPPPPHSQSSRQEHFNKLPMKPEIKGQFRAEPVILNKGDFDIKDANFANANFAKEKKSHDIMNRTFDTGQFRAEPVNLQAGYFVQNHQSKGVHNDSINNMMPPKPAPKIQRSNSELNHGQNNRHIHSRLPAPQNHYSKPALQNQGVKRMYNADVIRKTPQFYGRQESALPAPMRTDTTLQLQHMAATNYVRPTIRTAVNNNINSNHNNNNNINNNTNNNIIPVVSVVAADGGEAPPKEEKPPLPEKKCVSKRADIQKVYQVSLQKVGELPSIEPPSAPPTKPLDEPPSPPVEESSDDKSENKIEELKETKTIDDNKVDRVVPKDCKPLQTRDSLPEESDWEATRVALVRSLSADHPIRALLSEFHECDTRAKKIVNAFLLDDTNCADEEFSEIIETMEGVELHISESETNGGSEETYDWNSKDDKLKVEDRLKVLIDALEVQSSVLEKKMNTNEELGTSVAAALEKPYSTRVARLMTDIGLITSLIASLVSRYDRLSRSLKGALKADHQDKTTLETEMGRLQEKLEDARALKASIDGNRTKLLSTLRTELKEDLMDSFKYAIGRKTRLVVHARDVKDRLDVAKRLLTAIHQE